MKINTVYNECCLNTMARMADQSVDLIITSPPYNMGLRAHGGQYVKRSKSDLIGKKYEHFDDAMPIGDFYAFHKKALSEMLRVCKIAFYNIQIVTGSKEAFFMLMGDYARYIKDVIVWHKGEGEPAMGERVMNAAHELILVLESDMKIGRSITNARFERGKLSNHWRKNSGSQETDGHSAAFPMHIAEKIVINFSGPGDIVYDPFGGTGTTCMAAKKNNRRWMMSEISQEYSQTAKKRIESLYVPETLFETC